MSTVRQASTVAVRAAVRQPCRGRKCDGPRLREHAQRGASTTCRSSKSQEYTELMKDKMRWNQDAPYDYSFERGLYYHHILENELLCGSQPTCADDIRYLRDMEDVDTIISLQEEKDPHHWGVDTGAIHHAINECGINFIRTEVVDFDKGSLRYTLPRAVHHTAHALNAGKKVYVHCTAGLGRAPATCIAYMFWFREFNLDQAYEHLTSIRPCGPSKDAIRGATFDLMSGGEWDSFESISPDAYTTLDPIHKQILDHLVLKEQ